MTMIAEYDKVRIKATGETGEVVDVSVQDGLTLYTIESYKMGEDGYPRFVCAENQIEKIKDG